MLSAAILLDAWSGLNQLEGWPELGRLLAEVLLKERVTANHLSPVCLGLRKSEFRWRRQEPFGARLSDLMTEFERAATETMDQLDRLQIAEDRFMRMTRTCRRHSRLPGFAKLFLEHPLVTIPMARDKLGVTAAAA